MNSNRFFAVENKDGNKEYFDYKMIAKKYRDKLIGDGFKAAHVTFGPDHPQHKANRKAPSWNKGRHPKRKAVNKLFPVTSRKR
jgi:hypothetical protein